MAFYMHGCAYAVVDNLLRKSNVGELSVLSPPRPPATAGKLRTRSKDWAKNGDGGQARDLSLAARGSSLVASWIRGTKSEGTAKTADGGRRPGIGIRERGKALRIVECGVRS